MNDYNEIITGLFVGNKNAIESHEFDDTSLIINCTHDIPIPDKYTNHIRLSVKDDPYESDTLFTLLSTTDVLYRMHSSLSHNIRIIVHCSMGIQRSCAVVACYLIKYNNMTPSDAISYIRTRRPIAFFGQVNFIKTLERVYSGR
jgi:protein-tyrosine phosphatase